MAEYLYPPKAEISCTGSGRWASVTIDAPAGVIQASGIGQSINQSVLVISAIGTVQVLSSPYITFTSLHPKSNWVGWSKIGDVRLLIDMSNEAGYRPMDWPGAVYNILQLGKFAIVYGSNGITQMVPVSAPYATFGFKDMSEVGIYHKGCVAGDKDVHYFIDSNKALWKLTESKGAEYLGYKEYIEALIPTNPDYNRTLMLSYDPINKRVYISSMIGGLILTESGMGGGIANITSIQRSGQSLLFGVPQDLIIPNFECATDILDFGTRSIKTVQSVEIGIDLTEELYVAMDYRFDKSQSFSTSAWKRCNKEGVGFPIISGVEFRIRVKSNYSVSCELDYINVRYKATDKRFHRGTYTRKEMQGDS